MLILPPRTGTLVHKPRAISQIHGAAASATTQNLPAGIRDGDIGLFHYAINGNPIPSTVIPSGWTQIATHGLNFWRCVVSYKRLVATDSSAAVAGQGTGSFPTSQLVVLRPWPLGATLTLGTVNSQAIATAPSQQTVDMSGVDSLALVLGFAFHGGGGGNTISGAIATEGIQAVASTIMRVVYIPYERHAQFGNKTWGMNQAGDPNCLTSTRVVIT